MSEKSKFFGVFPPSAAGSGTYIDQRVTSHNQSGGITAHTVNIGSQQRTITEALKQQIRTQVPRALPITVVAVMGDGEALRFAHELHAFLSSEGFPLRENGVSQAMYSEPVEGLAFNPVSAEFVVGNASR